MQDLERRLAALTAEHAAMTSKFTALSVTSDRLTAENNALSFRIANLTGLVDQLNTSLEKEKQTNGRLKIDNYNLKRSIKAAEVRFILGSKLECSEFIFTQAEAQMSETSTPLKSMTALAGNTSIAST